MTPDEFASELDRVEALLKWWGAPGFGYDGFTQTHLKRFETIMAELEKAAGEIAAQQEEALTQSKDLLVQSLPAFVSGHDLNDVLAAQSKILVSLLEAASAQAKTWMSFSDKIRHAQLSLAQANGADSANGHDANGVIAVEPGAPRKKTANGS
jgi:hypothetical protein